MAELRRLAKPEVLSAADAQAHVGVIRTALLQSAELLEMRFKYLNVVPWSFCNADSQAGAQKFLDGVRAHPLEAHDDLTRYYYEEYQESSEIRARGEECPPALLEEVDIHNQTPLDESPGEGYHRSTNHSRVRASSAKSPYLKQATRSAQNMKLMKEFIAYGENGKKVLRFEWRKWGRILQTKHSRASWNKQVGGASALLARVYRMDSKAEEDWSWVAAPLHTAGQDRSTPSSYDAIRGEAQS